MGKAVVTGGAGFIGSHLVERLVRAGRPVTVIDNLKTGRRKNLAGLDASALTFFEADVCDTQLLQEAFAGAEVVYHLAALADIVPSIERPDDYFRANVDGTFSVMQAARSAGVRRVMYAASSSCYGIPDTYPTPESAEIRPQYPYALTKYLGEAIVLHWGQVYDIAATSLRLFNVYGPRARTTGTYGAVFGVFLAQKLAGSPMTVVGDGKQTRDFTYVTDVADAFVQAASRAELGGQIMNVGSGNTYSVNQLVELLGGPITHIPKRPGEPDQTFADVTKIRRLLGWSARVPFEDGVHTMLEHIDDWRDAPVWTPASIADATRTWFTYLGKAEPAATQ
ncbi:MAG TPA: SDR family oxidoreductase [Candidatus Binatia bacterium]|nr:SDR family oxidoreductase [Candidatus Binatia bacterium]